MYVRRKVFSTVEQPEEQLFSVEMNEQEYALFSAFKAGYEEAMFTWQDAAGNIWKGAKGDKSQGLANVVGEIGEKEKISKGKFGKGAFQAGTGTNLEAAKELTAEEKKALAKQNKEAIKAGKKEAGAKWKAEHSKENVKKVNSQVAATKAKLAEAAENRARIASKAAAAEKARLLKKGGKIAGGVALGGAALGAGIYGYKKVANKA